MAENHGIQKYTVAESNNLQLNQKGLDVVAEHNSNTQEPGHGGSWIALQCIAAVVPTGTAYASQFVQLVSTTSNIGDDYYSMLSYSMLGRQPKK